MKAFAYNIVFLYILQAIPLLTKENGTQALETSLDDKNDTNKDQAQKPKKQKRFGGVLKYMKRGEPKKRPEVTISMQDISSPKRTQDLQNLYDDITKFWWNNPSQKITVESVKFKFTHVTDEKVIEEVFYKLHNEGLINKELFVPRRTKFEYFWLFLIQFVIHGISLVIEVVNGGFKTDTSGKYI
jgi:hypothetical protein